MRRLAPPPVLPDGMKKAASRDGLFSRLRAGSYPTGPRATPTPSASRPPLPLKRGEEKNQLCGRRFLSPVERGRGGREADGVGGRRRRIDTFKDLLPARPTGHMTEADQSRISLATWPKARSSACTYASLPAPETGAVAENSFAARTTPLRSLSTRT